MSNHHFPPKLLSFYQMEFPLINLYLFFSLTIQTILVSEYASVAAIMLSNDTDKFALLEFKSILTEDPQGVVVSWNDSIHFCSWNGIKCGRKHQRVTGLDLRGQNLAGNISPHLGNLSFLRTLDLAEIFFLGGIPPEIGRLIRLRSLNLSSNFLRGNIPVNLSNCSNLKTLALDHNYLTQQIPPELDSLSKLEKLYLTNNNLTGNFPASFGNLSSIQELVISFNHLQGEIPDAIGQMKSLTRLGLGINNFSGVFPPALYNLTSLQALSLSSNFFYGNLRPDIGRTFPAIRKLILGGNQFAGHIPVSLSNASNLLQLDLGSNNFLGSVPMIFGNLQDLLLFNVPQNHLGNGAVESWSFLTSLGNCSRLQFLDLSYNKFGGELPKSIANLSTQLRWLNLYNNSISGRIPADIANLVGLNALGMGLNFLTGNMPASFGKLPNLKELYLGSNLLTGEVPTSYGNLTQLLYLHLHNNSLEGIIPSNFGNFKYLQELDLSHNKLNGIIPKQLIGLSSLSRGLNLSHNSLSGSLPAEVENLRVLVALDVSYNKLSGDIPSKLGLCLALEQLYIQGNYLQGNIPYFGQLTGLRYLDLSSNKLDGKIPQYFVNLSSLLYLNLSYNNLEGEVPVAGIFKNTSVVEVFGNNLCGGIQQLHLRPCPVLKHRKPRKHIDLKWILVIAIVSSCLGLILSLFLLYSTKKSKQKPLCTPTFEHFHPKITYKELCDATSGFSSHKLIGSGNFGAVYEGILGPDETTVAIKVLNLQQRGASKSFMAECQALRNIRHRNLVRVLTACSSADFEGNDFKALVYQFMPNGSLEKWLYPVIEKTQQRSLNLLQRMNIAIDVASGMHYLHLQCQTPVVHCDLKPSNVLLDSDLTAHISDFGLAKLLLNFNKEAQSNQSSSLGIKGTIGYTAPEYGMGGEVSTQGDVYSYGILLLEMLTGRRPTDESFRDNFDLCNFVKLSLPDQVMEIVDQSVLNEQLIQNVTDMDDRGSGFRSELTECLISVFQIGIACSDQCSVNRMNMGQVLRELLSIRGKFPGAGMQGQRIGRIGQ